MFSLEVEENPAYSDDKDRRCALGRRLRFASQPVTHRCFLTHSSPVASFSSSLRKISTSVYVTQILLCQ